MNKHLIPVLIILLWSLKTISAPLPHGYPETDRIKQSLNQNWKFHRGDPNADYYRENYDDTSWQDIHVPHTLALTSLTLDNTNDEKTQLKFHRDVGWYRKFIHVSDNPHNKVFIEFEGVHQVTDLWINGQHVGQHAVGGYTPFHFDITPFIKRGQKNQMTVLADNRRSDIIPPDPGPFDYVKFSGLYRDVYLVETHPVHVTFNWESLNSGVTITTPTIDTINKNATINIKTAVKNELKNAINAEIITRIIDKKGVVVLKLKQTHNMAAGQEYQFNQIGSLEDNVHFWDTENPYLYRVNSLIRVNGKNVDFTENTLGLRQFEHHAERGFLLNNKPIKLIGYNRHQQYPYIGDAVPNTLHYKDIQQFKAFGFNVLRTAHYPQDDAILNACDELGILVYEEAPTWISISQNPQWWENLDSATRTMVRNHRNHPSVVIWGAGINHRGYVPAIHNAIKQEDPTRLTASQNSSWSGWQASGLSDLNANMLYGPFIWDRAETILAMEGHMGPKHLAPIKKDPKMTGLIAWTAHAYYTFHPTHDKAQSHIDRTRRGMMTIFRYPRPEHHWYKAELRQEPFIHIQQDWLPGTKTLTVFSNANEVALQVNGKEIARGKPSADKDYQGLDHPPFHFKNIHYQEGTLVAKALFSDGTSIQASKKTPGKPYALALKLDTEGRNVHADGSDIVMAYARVIDKHGETVANTPHKVHFSVKGSATIVGDQRDINANPMFTEYGVAPALIRAGKKPGKITIIAKAAGLKPAKKTMDLTATTNNEIANNAKPIYDLTHERIDLGAHDQLQQFGWQAWNGEDGNTSSYSLQAFPGASITINAASKNGTTRWLGEMNVIGKYGFTYGDGVIAIDDKGLTLTLKGLPKGEYALTTWHHAPKSHSDIMDPNKDKLEKLTTHTLPYEKTLTIVSQHLRGAKKHTVSVTAGKAMQSTPPGTAQITVKTDGHSPIIIHFLGSEKKGIWLNALTLSEWHPSLN